MNEPKPIQKELRKIREHQKTLGRRYALGIEKPNCGNSAEPYTCLSCKRSHYATALMEVQVELMDYPEWKWLVDLIQITINKKDGWDYEYD
jgi:hypothetical protein